MKNIYFSCILLLVFFVSNKSYSQKLYDDINPLAETKGRRLTVGSSTNPMFPGDLLSLEYQDTANFNYKLNLYADYRQWKFTKNLLLGGYVRATVEYQKAKFNAGIIPVSNTSESKNFNTQLYGAASYYLMPNKVYVTGALGLSLQHTKQVYTSDPGPTPPTVDSTIAPAFFWGALGYGRINNRQVVEVAYDFDESLMKKGITDRKLDDNTLRKISEMLYRQADGEYQDKYEDDQYSKLFKDIEAELLTAGYIDGKLGAEQAITMYEILRNTSKKYIFYPKYSGYQVQGQVQYQLANESKDKTHEHYFSLSGAYCLNLTNKTNMVFSGFFAVPLDTAAFKEAPIATTTSDFENYLAFLPDRNNLDFFKTFIGAGEYGKRYVTGLHTMYGVRADVYHSLSSVAGVSGTLAVGVNKFKYLDANVQFLLGARIDYNIFNSLTSYGKIEVLKETDPFEVTPTKYSLSAGFSYRIF
ncbi:MAG: hypothetical protein JST55_02785 [Bacteroidetes bacterium]|nr:hypothetical protein [Bacteroidota bacterium]